MLKASKEKNKKALHECRRQNKKRKATPSSRQTAKRNLGEDFDIKGFSLPGKP
jgi:hypothetical protein